MSRFAHRNVRLGVCVMAFVMRVTGLEAQTASPAVSTKQETATEFYQRFKIALASAKTIDDVLPFWPTEMVSQFRMAPPATKTSTLAMMKQTLSETTDITVTAEKSTPQGAVLSLRGRTKAGQSTLGTADIVKEDSGWKIAGPERWSDK